LQKPFLPLLFFIPCAALAIVQGPGLKCVQLEDEIKVRSYSPIRVTLRARLGALPPSPRGRDRENKAGGWTLALFPTRLGSSSLTLMRAFEKTPNLIQAHLTPDQYQARGAALVKSIEEDAPL